jgi:tRNA(Ile2)-agmatinylcytidine synthase|tara:strand:- start:4740 stop:5990 length:1251 start_codon:yes stop_codon:yes gene_type:complete
MLHVGIDDTDSIEGMCTTYLGALLSKELEKFCKVENIRLLRLNPNIKWKTRGNASLNLVLNTKNPNLAKKTILQVVLKNSMMKDKNTNPGVVFYEGNSPEKFRGFYWRCIRDVVKIEDAEKLASENGLEVHKFNNGRGIIGALAAIGNELTDKTYELIAYRSKLNWGTERKVDSKSVIKMNAHTYPYTFNNIDPTLSKILITPHSPCPVLLGIRGENKWILKHAFRDLIINETVNQMIIFETNQGTDAHLHLVRHARDAKLYSSIILKGTVVKTPWIIEGGHVIFSIYDGNDNIDCAAYEPTKDFRWKVARLRKGDFVKVYGSLKYFNNYTINLEKIEILKLKKIYEEYNPLCRKCGKRMKSAGRNQKIRCKKCKTEEERKMKVLIQRRLENKTYQVPPSAMRHLSKPLVRVGNIR